VQVTEAPASVPNRIIGSRGWVLGVLTSIYLVNFIDRQVVFDGQGKVYRTGTSRYIVLAAPARNAAGDGSGGKPGRTGHAACARTALTASTAGASDQAHAEGTSVRAATGCAKGAGQRAQALRQLRQRLVDNLSPGRIATVARP
jgi:hypothetical protein